MSNYFVLRILTQNTAEAAACLQLIAAEPSCAITKIAHWCYLPVRISTRTHAYMGVFADGTFHV